MSESIIKTPIGKLRIDSKDESLCSIRLTTKNEKRGNERVLRETEKWLLSYFKSPTKSKNEPELDFSEMSEFEKKVLKGLMRVPSGTTVSYADLADKVGYPGAARAVGSVMRKNPYPLMIPCHRVVRSDGKIGEYSLGGPKIKKFLLDLESDGLDR